MLQTTLYSLPDTATRLGISEAVIDKFIKKGLITPVADASTPKLTPYGLRRLTRILELYEHSCSLDHIERALNS